MERGAFKDAEIRTVSQLKAKDVRMPLGAVGSSGQRTRRPSTLRTDGGPEVQLPSKSFLEFFC